MHETFVSEVAAVAADDYETERGKPMPNLTHGAIQANLIFELKSAYGKSFRVASEVALDTKPLGSTPDVVVYPPRNLDFVNEPAKRSDAPLLAIEILSASQSLDEMVAKANTYFNFGVKSCWIVLPSLQAVVVYERQGQYQFFHLEETLRDPNLGIEMHLPNVFA